MSTTMQPEHTRHRVLVVANETVTSDVLRRTIELAATRTETDVLVVAPALNTRLGHWSSADDGARRSAEERLAACLASLRRDGVRVEGLVGDADPLLAAEDALRLFPADELVIATHPEGQSNWLARNVVARARVRFRIPIVHIVVDPVRGREFIAA
jgi:GABA permease